MKKVLCLAALAVGMIGVSAAHASGSDTHSARSHETLGMAFAHRIHASSVPGGTGQLLYYEGAVMHTNTSYAG